MQVLDLRVGIFLHQSSCQSCGLFWNNKVQRELSQTSYTAQKIEFFIKDLFSKCDQIRRKLKKHIYGRNPEEILNENFIFCAVLDKGFYETSYDCY